jgi:hypothetical protein
MTEQRQQQQQQRQLDAVVNASIRHAYFCFTPVPSVLFYSRTLPSSGLGTKHHLAWVPLPFCRPYRITTRSSSPTTGNKALCMNTARLRSKSSRCDETCTSVLLYLFAFLLCTVPKKGRISAGVTHLFLALDNNSYE